MTQLTHGGDWAGYRAQYGHDALDFSANVSPLGLPPLLPPCLTPTATTTPCAGHCGQSWPRTRGSRQNLSSAATARQT